MKTLIGGAIAALLGLSGILARFPQSLAVIAGTIPVLLLLGGALPWVIVKRFRQPATSNQRLSAGFFNGRRCQIIGH